MRGATQFEHHIIRDIDQCGDAALARALEPALHPLGRGRTGVDAADDAPRETAAQIGRVDARRQLVVDADRHGREGGLLQRYATQRRQLTGHTEHAHAVRQIGRELEHPNGFIEIEPVANTLTDWRIRTQDEQATVILGEPELTCRAEHAAALDAPHLGDLDLHAARHRRARQGTGHPRARHHVGRTADDLGNALAGIHLADLELVRIGVRRHRTNLGNHDPVEGRCGRVGLLDFESGHGEPLADQACGPVGRCEAAQPAFRNTHARSSSVELLQKAQIVFIEEA